MRDLMITGVAAATLTATAFADYSITQAPTAPTYAGHQIDFDQPGDPTGAITGTEWLASDGITIGSGVGDGGAVDDWDAVFGPFGIGDGNSHLGAFGTFLTFTQDLTEMSIEVWNNGTDPFFGGIGIFLFDDGVEVGSFFTIPSWAGVGDAAFDITTSGGDVFDEVRVIDFDFASVGIITDNYSWNAIPAPGALALLALAGCGRRRRRD
ncbi:MAG: hypothetical protein HKO59_04265 [Phycisphaerales bacterium]|nr:hypothetical protein [Phycisphaerae bacterium]NNF42126.1 hypothetical protein [Phycisphaerales bacterium]NNM25191.1 hypothetical protein [Phycisphaerales bacterium]